MTREGRPSRSSKERALQTIHQLGYEEESNDYGSQDHSPVRHYRSARRHRGRSTRNVIDSVTSEEDDEDLHPNGAEKKPIGHEALSSRFEHLEENDEHSASVSDEHPDHDQQQHQESSSEHKVVIPQNLLTEGSTVTKSGRVSKPPQHTLPMSPPRTPRTRRTNKSPDIPETREQRLERRRRRAEEAPLPNYTPMERSRPRRARKTRTTYIEDDDDDDDDDDHIDQFINIPMQGQENTLNRSTRSRIVKLEDRDNENGHARPVRRSSRTRVERVDLTYGGKPATSNGVEVPMRQTRSRTRYASRPKLSDEEVDDDEADGDGDYPTPGSGEDSADQEMEDAVFEEDPGVLEHDSGLDNAAPRRSRRNRKAQPQRSVPAKRKRRSTRANHNESSIARDTRKSYVPRSQSLRPSDFYPEADTASDESFSSAGLRPAAKRSRPIRAAASRAGDAIAKKFASVDYLQNPMAIVDDAAPQPTRQSRDGRYNRRKSRLRPARIDPLASDDDAAGGNSLANGIEPIQVDLNLSWEDVGGLDHHIRALKEMVALPLMYPEVFEKFKMEAPKGVLFYGPPGTGKTLCARALAASCGSHPLPMTNPPTASGKGTEGEGNPEGVGPGSTEVNRQSEALPQNSNHNKDAMISDHPEGTPRDVQLHSVNSGIPNKMNEPMAIEPPSNELPGAEILADEHAIVMSKRAKDFHGSRGKGDKASEGKGLIGSQGSQASNVLEGNRKPRPRVAFFMRNGADCLSKWVGEAERQLRMTFEAAKKHQPSIIFFDEIDGLAPVRSSRQDQIHSSIVSTLLGLMDGLDARGQVVVIGATNRVDAIDPALRRPGRFDRELIFNLPNAQARRKILGIHTSKWSPPPSHKILDAVANMTVGYCGADLKSLCSESALRALRRRYPQIYESRDKLLINPDEVKVRTRDFLAAMQEIVPASHRSARTFARPISARLLPLLKTPMDLCMNTLKKIFPQGLESPKSSTPDAGRNKTDGGNGEASASSSEEDDDISDDENSLVLDGENRDISNAGKLRPSASKSMDRHHTHRPRLLVCGESGLGQAQLGPAILHNFESCPVHAIDFPTLLADAGSRSAEEALVISFREAMRSVPSILYLSHLQLWWESASESMKTTLVIALKDVPADLPLLILATAEKPIDELPQEVRELFEERVHLSPPSENDRICMFDSLVTLAQTMPKISASEARRRRKKRKAEVLPLAPPEKTKPPTEEENFQKILAEDRFIRRLRMEMRTFVETLLRDKRYKAFWSPVDPLSAPDYYDIIKEPIDISKIASNIDLGKYPTVLALANDFEILVRNAIQYNPPNTESGSAILRRAHGLIDVVHAWVDNLNPVLVEACNKIIADRLKRSRDELEAKKEKLEGRGLSVETRQTEIKENIDCDTNKGEQENGIVNMSGVAPEVLSRRSSDVKQLVVGEGKLPSRSTEQGYDENGEKSASQDDVMLFWKLFLGVSSSATVDELESVYMKCAKMVRREKRNKDRSAVVQRLIEIVKGYCEAVVGSQTPSVEASKG